MSLLDYLKNHQRFFFFDKKSQVKSYCFSNELLKILKDLLNLSHDQIISKVPKIKSDKERDFLGKILYKFGQKKTSYEITSNLRTKFELAIELENLDQAQEFC